MSNEVRLLKKHGLGPKETSVRWDGGMEYWSTRQTCFQCRNNLCLIALLDVSRHRFIHAI